MGRKLRLKLGLRRAKTEELGEGASEDFKSQLSLVLRSPQGTEIQKRNWRVSDKFRGGEAIKMSGAQVDRFEAYCREVNKKRSRKSLIKAKSLV